jgi:hypothetical protein
LFTPVPVTAAALPSGPKESVRMKPLVVGEGLHEIEQ